MPLLRLRDSLALALLLVSSTWVQGQEFASPPSLSGPSDGVPPPSAIDACLNKTENSACEFGGRGGSDSGLCMFTADKKYFACDPHGGEERPGEGPGANGQEPPPRPGESDNADNSQEPPPRPDGSNDNGQDAPPRPDGSSDNGQDAPPRPDETGDQSSAERGITRFPSHLYSAEE